VAAAREVYVAAMAQGLAELDYSAIIETVERAAGGTIKAPSHP
jgi:hypothetical protein